jgi:hypothetical protein
LMVMNDLLSKYSIDVVVVNVRIIEIKLGSRKQR